MYRKTQTSYLCSTAPAVFSAGAADFVNTHMRYAVVFSVISRPTSETKYGSEFFFLYCIFCTHFAVCLHRDSMLFPLWDVWQRS